MDDTLSDALVSEIKRQLEYSFLNDSSLASAPESAPCILTNIDEKNIKVVTAIEKELENCNGYDFSVAFVNWPGIHLLLGVLKDLDASGVKGRLLTSDYLTFTEPRAFESLMYLKNLQIRMYRCKNAGFHTKGYLFSKSDHTSHLIIGSSNLTNNALCVNQEWNVRLVCSEQGALTKMVRRYFENLWNQGQDIKEALKDYAALYEEARKKREKLFPKNTARAEDKIKPNSMQRRFIENLKNLIDRGEKRALLISATGTGKTYAAALAMRELNARSVLFLVHREQIARKSLESFKRVFEGKVTCGLLSGSSRETDADFVFGTVQSVSKENVLKGFEPDRFEFVIIDEAHHSEAASYKEIISWFTPKMLLGMTATPERTRNSKDTEDIFTLFDHNIALEIRLQDALESDELEKPLICPFHYFGVSDISVNGQSLDEETDFSYLVSDERVRHIIETAEYYKYSGKKVHGLIFCRSIKEAKELSLKLNDHGYRTLALSGADSQQERERAVERLEADDGDYLDYILSQEIFNEGIDIPCVNQVILLRPTESPIVFVQQLGRGLRRYQGKEFTVIIDFIANYRNNFMVPLALSGDKSWSKDNYRRYVAEGSRVIKGFSTIHFDAISKKRIYESIDTTNFSQISNIKKNYQDLKERLGHIPSIFEYDQSSGMDILRLFDNRQLRCYHTFLKKYEPEYKDAQSLNSKEELVVQFISCRFVSGKRPHELLMLRGMLDNSDDLIAYTKEALLREYSIESERVDETNLFNIMSGTFEQGVNLFNECVLVKRSEKGTMMRSDMMSAMLKNPVFRGQVADLVSLGLSRYERDYKDRYTGSMLTIGRGYSYRDVARLLNWDVSPVPQNISGYKYDEKTKSFPIFINYVKGTNVNAAVRYEDRFISPGELITMSKNSRTTSSSDVTKMIHAKELGIRVGLFMRKNTRQQDEGKEFYFLGDMELEKAENKLKADGSTKIVELKWKLKNEVEHSLYDYMTTSD